MLPTVNTLLTNEIEITDQPSYTFHLDLEKNDVIGYADGRKAMVQAIYLILSIERYRYVTLPWSYGVEFEDLYGMPISWVIPESKRRIQEAILHDVRVFAVKDFDFEVVEKGKLAIHFTANTIFGDVDLDWSVNF